MAAMALLLAVDYLRTRRIPPMHALSAVLVFVFGAATLVLHDQRFIQWKPTIFFWLLSLAFLASIWIGERPLVQRLIGAALGDDAQHAAPRTGCGSTGCGSVLRRARRAELLVAFNAQRAHLGQFQSVRPDRCARSSSSPRRSCGCRGAHAPVADMSAAAERIARIREALEQRFAPSALEIMDDSAAHAGHAGAREGGHFRVTLVADDISRPILDRAPSAGLRSGGAN